MSGCFDNCEEFLDDYFSLESTLGSAVGALIFSGMGPEFIGYAKGHISKCLEHVEDPEHITALQGIMENIQSGNKQQAIYGIQILRKGERKRIMRAFAKCARECIRREEKED